MRRRRGEGLGKGMIIIDAAIWDRGLRALPLRRRGCGGSGETKLHPTGDFTLRLIRRNVGHGDGARAGAGAREPRSNVRPPSPHGAPPNELPTEQGHRSRYLRDAGPSGCSPGLEPRREFECRTFPLALDPVGPAVSLRYLLSTYTIYTYTGWTQFTVYIYI